MYRRIDIPIGDHNVVVSGDLGAQHIGLWAQKTSRNWTFSIVWGRIFRPWQWFLIHTNHARKGIDSCFDFTFCLFIFCFNYTNFSYNIKR